MSINYLETHRRRFLKETLAGAVQAVAVPYFFSGMPKLAVATESKNDRINIGLIGAGGMGVGNMEAARDWCDVIAIADVDRSHADNANQKLSQGKAAVFDDYRNILERTDIDAIHIATPDHWHAKALIESMLAGFDVYCEKPLTLTIDEGKKIREVARKTGRVVQVGTQQRSQFDTFVKAIALVKDGRLGRIKRIEARIDRGEQSPSIPSTAAPKTLDWDRWLGPTPKIDYRQLARDHVLPYSNCHYEFRWWYQFSGGKLTDWGAHHIDIAMWALAANNQLPKSMRISGTAQHDVPLTKGMPTVNDRYNTATDFHFIASMPDGVELLIQSTGDNGVLIEGEKGRIFVNRGKLTGKPIEELKENPLPEDVLPSVYKNLPMVGNERRAHWANFFHCIRERVEPISDIDSHVTSINVAHLATICGRLNRDIQWDAVAEQIRDDEEAQNFLSRPYRTGYEIEG